MLSVIEGKLDPCNLAVLRAVRRRAQEESISVYLVGGPVRDVLLDAPVKDLDFVVEGDAPRLAQRLAVEVGGEVVTHSRFGTATVALPDCRVDVVTARREVYPHPGTLPQVFPSAISDDLARRDFTVNAIALSLREDRPRLVDPHGGAADLRQRVIRTLHPNSFIDDPTRILRAVRYEQRLGFHMDPYSLEQLRDALAQGCMGTVTGDRLRHELERIFHEPEPYPALRRAGDLGVLSAVYPALGAGDALARLSESGGLSPETAEAGPLVWLAALAYPLSPESEEGVIRRLNLPNAWAEVVRDTVEMMAQREQLASPSLSCSQLYHLMEGRCLPAVAAFAGMDDSPAAERAALYLRELRKVAPALRGEDLLAMGVPRGPEVGRALRRLLDARLDGRVDNETQERALVAELLAAEGGLERNDG